MPLSFQEKSLWVSLAALVAAFGGYLLSVLEAVVSATAGVDVMPQQAGSFLAATMVLVVLLVAGHAVMALPDRQTQADERDRSIELRGGKYGSCALGSWVLAQGIEIISQLVMYRRGR